MKINQKKKAEEVGDRRGMSGESKAVNVWTSQLHLHLTSLWIC